jgi:DNA-binding SARP family transcriptional activator
MAAVSERPLASTLSLSRSTDVDLPSLPGSRVGDDGPSRPVVLPPPGRDYVVQPGDTLWSIAEKELQSPLEWRQIADLNYGRPQSDGLALVSDHWIRPGWVLVLPVEEAAPASSAAPLPNAGADTLNGAIASQARAITPDKGMTIGDWSHGTRSPAGTRASDSIPDRSTGRVAGAAGTGRRSAGRGGTSAPHVPVVPIGYGLLGAGVIALLERMRRAQQRKRPTGLRIVLPDGDLAELERGLRVAADQGSVEWIDLGLRLLAAIVRREGLTPPSISAVRLTDDAVELLIEPGDQTPFPPEPFSPGGRGDRWVLRRSGELLEALRGDAGVSGQDAPLPSLVTLGRDQSGLFMINIERAGSVAVSGDDADRLIQGIVVELATAPWADQIDLILVGFPGSQQGLERVTHAGSLQTVHRMLERRTRERTKLLALAPYSTNAETRWRDGGDVSDLCVVVCGPEAARREVATIEAITDLVGDGSLGVVVVSGIDIERARWRVRAETGRISVVGLGMVPSSLSSQDLPADLVEGVTALVSLAADTEGVAQLNVPDDSPRPEPRPRAGEGEADAEARAGEEGDSCSDTEVEVRVLGPVEILGAARPFTRAWAIELIVYLAMHPGGVSNDQWSTALWPDRVMAPASQHSTASAARRSLGMSRSGADHLPRARGRLALGPAVRSDWDTFVGLARESEPGSWRRALELVRGRPFDGIRSPDWVLLEGIQATVEAVVVDVAIRYAQHCLDVRDAPSGEWAARQGLRVSPYDERLYRVLMRTSDAAGNPAGVEAVMAELIQLVAQDVEPFDAVHPETVALYRSLSRRSQTARIQ